MTVSRLVCLFVDVDDLYLARIAGALESAGVRAIPCSLSAADAVAWEPADAVVVNGDVSSGLAAASYARRRLPDAPVIVVTRCSTEELAIAALRAGASEYLRDPSAEAIASAIGALVQNRRTAGGEMAMAAGAGSKMQSILAYVSRIARTDCNVLVTGETGTGKELIARLIHRNSRRADRPLACVNCAAIPDNLLESELFGYERGAFTGAVALNAGQLERADGGTVFFDEIGEMSPHAQAKVLRVIEDRRVQRLGGHKAVALDIRIIAATNRDLDSLAMENQFRKDLYFRLNVARIHLPPLRERRADIPGLVRHYLSEFNAAFGAKVVSVGDGVMETMLRYPWPGNVRELRNVLEAVFATCPASTITHADLPDWFRKRASAIVPESGAEPDRLLAALEEVNWNKSKAATMLNWSRMKLYRKMAQYNLSGLAPDRMHDTPQPPHKHNSE